MSIILWHSKAYISCRVSSVAPRENIARTSVTSDALSPLNSTLLASCAIRWAMTSKFLHANLFSSPQRRLDKLIWETGMVHGRHLSCEADGRAAGLAGGRSGVNDDDDMAMSVRCSGTYPGAIYNLFVRLQFITLMAGSFVPPGRALALTTRRPLPRRAYRERSAMAPLIFNL